MTAWSKANIKKPEKRCEKCPNVFRNGTWTKGEWGPLGILTMLPETVPATGLCPTCRGKEMWESLLVEKYADCCIYANSCNFYGPGCSSRSNGICFEVRRRASLQEKIIYKKCLLCDSLHSSNQCNISCFFCPSSNKSKCLEKMNGRNTITQGLCRECDAVKKGLVVHACAA